MNCEACAEKIMNLREYEQESTKTEKKWLKEDLR